MEDCWGKPPAGLFCREKRGGKDSAAVQVDQLALQAAVQMDQTYLRTSPHSLETAVRTIPHAFVGAKGNPGSRGALIVRDENGPTQITLAEGNGPV